MILNKSILFIIWFTLMYSAMVYSLNPIIVPSPTPPPSLNQVTILSPNATFNIKEEWKNMDKLEKGLGISCGISLLLFLIVLSIYLGKKLIKNQPNIETL